MDSYKGLTNSKMSETKRPGPIPSPQALPVQATIDSKLKAAAESVFASLGLTPSEAIRLFYTQVALHRGLPFELKIPQETTTPDVPIPAPAPPPSTEPEPEDPDDLKSYENIDQLFDNL